MNAQLQSSCLVMNATRVKPLRVFLSASCLLVVLFCASISITAETISDKTTPLDQLLTDIQQKVNSTKTVQCTFEQERNLSVFDRPIVFTGKMELSRPDKLRWENLAPIPSVLIFDGDKGIRCNDDAPPVHFELEKDPIMKMVAEQIWIWVDGDYARMRNKYNITLTGEREIALVPQSGEFAGIITSVRVTFDNRSLQPETIHILEDEGDSTRIRFANYRLNQPVDDMLFTTCYP
jgi:outer membrane lipoprotein-sorting protein